MNPLRKLWPLPAGYDAAGPSIDELRPKYQKWDFLGFGLFVVAIAPCIGLWWLFLWRVAAWYAYQFEPATFHLHVSGIAVAVPSILLGIITAVGTVYVTYRCLLGERFPEFIRYDNLTVGFDSTRMLRLLLLGTAVLSFLLVVVILSWHTLFREDRIDFHSWCGIGNTSKLYSEVSDIRSAPQFRAPNGNLVDRREYVVEFDDGSTWFTNWEPSGLDQQAKQKLVEFVAERAQKPIRELVVLD